MRLPAPLLRRNPKAYKNQFGHVLVIAGSLRMLGAAALCSLAALRAGAGLVTVGAPRSLNTALQKKVSNEVMTWPLPERSGFLDSRAFSIVNKEWEKFQCVAVGPGLGRQSCTKTLVFQLIKHCPLPMVVDADALNILSENIDILHQAKAERILTPHPGEMSRLTGFDRENIESNRERFTYEFALKYNCILLLKGHQTCVAAPKQKVYVNKTGNCGMATAGSGDVLTGMIAALIAQGVSPFEAAKVGCELHGRAGDRASSLKGKVSLIASDIIDCVPIIIQTGGTGV